MTDYDSPPLLWNIVKILHSDLVTQHIGTLCRGYSRISGSTLAVSKVPNCGNACSSKLPSHDEYYCTGQGRVREVGKKVTHKIRQGTGWRPQQVMH